MLGDGGPLRVWFRLHIIILWVGRHVGYRCHIVVKWSSASGSLFTCLVRTYRIICWPYYTAHME